VNFVGGYERLLFFFYEMPVPESTLRLHRWLFRGLALALLILGTPRLVKERRWERLALIAGLAASLALFHGVAGPNMLRKIGTHRYGVVFLTPTALAFACLLRAVVPATAATQPRWRVVAGLPLAVALVVGWGLLLSIKVNTFDPMREGYYHESIWTFRADARDEYERAMRLIERDIARRDAGRAADGTGPVGESTPVPVFVQSYWTFMPLAYLSSSSGNCKVVRLIEDPEWEGVSSDDLLGRKRRELAAALRAGGYAVDCTGRRALWGERLIEDTVRTDFPPERIQQWGVATRGGGLAVVVYRLKDDASRLASQPSAPTGATTRVRR
jgi:hypothetical protein